MRVAITTLGCRLNQTESALLEGRAHSAGWRVVPWSEDADVYVVNSCVVTAAAARKTRQALRRARRAQPHALIVLAGCAGNLHGETLTAQGLADVVVANPAKRHFIEAVRWALQGNRGEWAAQGEDRAYKCDFVEPGTGVHSGRTRASLKIQEGCSFHCTYCIVPSTRGPARSRAYDDVLREARNLVAAGYLEVVLTGVNVATYHSGGRDLADLLEQLCSLSERVRWRLSSTEPGPVVSAIVALMRREPRVCPFLHLPMQHADDRILRKMGRQYTFTSFMEYVAHAVEQVPDLCVGSDVMVGFPGESDDHFQCCCAAVSSLPLAYVHVFTYSVRPGTAAADLPGRVPGDVATARHRTLAALVDRKARQFARSQVGKKRPVITEEQDSEGHWCGWSDNYLRVRIQDAPTEIEANRLLNPTITGVESGRGVIGRLA